MDILGIGCGAVDDVLYVDRYPSADSKVEVHRRERRCGGLTAVALMTAAQLGASCYFAGVLGDDELSRYVLAAMSGQGVAISTTISHPEARPAYSVIVVDETTQTRTILYDAKNVRGADELRPTAELIRSARVLYIDHYGISGMIRASRIAREAGIPVVADLGADQDPRFSELLGLVDHLILSRDFATRITGQSDPAAAARILCEGDKAVVVVTAGRQGCWYMEGPDSSPIHYPAFGVAALDTTGCGDVFHGAYAAGLARGMPLLDRLRLASAAAAIKAAQFAQPPGFPSDADVQRFLASRC